MEIEEIINDLVDKVKSVSHYNNAVSFALGAREIDPLNRNLTPPFVWVIYDGDVPRQDLTLTANVVCANIVLARFVLQIVLPYASQTVNPAGLLANYMPILFDTISAVHGTVAPNNQKWIYQGQQWVEGTDRMVWQQTYALAVLV